MKSIIAAFCDQAAAEQAIAYLESRGVTDAQILGSAGPDRLGTLSAFNIPDDKTQLYAELMRRGAIVIAAHTDHDARDMAKDLDQMGSIDLDAAHKRWRKSGWNGYDVNAMPFTASECANERAALQTEMSADRDSTAGRDVEVVEERVRVGKREVPREAVRVRTFVTERPVEQDVELRDEHIDVQRERVDEPISPAALDSTLGEDEYVVTARGEEAVVGKEARVVERVHVGKTADTRTERVAETERRQDVKVEHIDTDEATRTSRDRRR